MRNFTSPFLNFSIIASSPDDLNKIKIAFQDVMITLALHEAYLSVDKFLHSTNYSNTIDFLAMDLGAFNELEERKIEITFPIILFSDSPVASANNLIFDIISPQFNFERLEYILMKFFRIKQVFIAREEYISPQTAKHSYSKTFMIKKGKEFHLINSDNIPAFYTDKKITFAYDKSGKKFMIHLTLIELENILSPEIFFRANRQFLINRNYIQKIRQVDEVKFEIVIESGDFIVADINQQKFSKLRKWLEADLVKQ